MMKIWFQWGMVVCGAVWMAVAGCGSPSEFIDDDTAALCRSIEPALFSDANLKACVEKTGALEDCELDTLRCPFQEISDLTGTETLVYLTMLDLRGNSIHDVTQVGSLPQLLDLDLSANQVSDITPLSSIKTLTKLNLFANQVSDLAALQTLTELRSLELGVNSISDVTPLGSLSSLESLFLSNNALKEVDALKTLTALTELDLSGNDSTLSCGSLESVIASLTGLEFMEPSTSTPGVNCVSQ